MKYVLYLSYDGLTDPLGQSQITPYLVGLSKCGYKISVISFEKKTRKGFFTDVSESLKGANIDWYPLSYTKRPPILSAVWDIYRLRQLSNKLFKKVDFKIVHCRSYMTSLVGLYLKKRYHVKYVFDMRGFWADERVEGGMWNLKNPIFRLIYRFFKRKEISFLSNADYTISLTRNAKNIIHSWNKIEQQPIKIEIIPCCVDDQLFDLAKIDYGEKEKLKRNLQIDSNDFVLTYLGSIGTWYMLDEMLCFFQQLLDRNSNAKFLFLTNESERIILKAARKYQLPNDNIIVKSLPRNKVPLYLSISDISIFFIKPVFSKKASSPTKLGEIMSLGIPIIANTKIGDTDNVIKKNKTGILIDELSPRAFNEALDHLPDVLSIPKEEIVSTAKSFFSLKIGTEKYCQIYKTLLNDYD